MSGADAHIVRRPEVRDVLRAYMTEAFRQGSDGTAWDVVLLGRPWGFSQRDVETEILLWQGEAGTLVSPAMGRYRAEQLPRCQAVMLPGEGHLLVIDRMPDLVQALRRPAAP